MIKMYESIMLYVALCGCETWFLTIREEHRFKLFETRKLRTDGPKQEEVTETWRK